MAVASWPYRQIGICASRHRLRICPHATTAGFFRHELLNPVALRCTGKLSKQSNRFNNGIIESFPINIADKNVFFSVNRLYLEMRLPSCLRNLHSCFVIILGSSVVFTVLVILASTLLTIKILSDILSFISLLPFLVCFFFLFYCGEGFWKRTLWFYFTVASLKKVYVVLRPTCVLFFQCSLSDW